MPDSNAPAALYARISLDRTGQELGVQRQEEACRQLAERQGWDVTELYIDNSISAFDHRKRRPEYERMRQDYAAGRFKRMVVWDLDRLSRQPRELEDWIEAASLHGLELVTYDDSIDLRTDSGRMYARIKAAVARQEGEKKAARQRLSNLQRAKMGNPTKSSNRPYGYQEDQVSLDPVESEVVRGIFADFLAGMSQREICRRLNEAGHTTAQGGEWHQSYVKRMVRNPRYKGWAHYKGEPTAAGVWEPVVDEETWAMANAQLDQRLSLLAATGFKANTGPRNKYMLSGLIQCGVCGDTMTSRSSMNGGTRYRVYSCKQWHNSRRADMVEQVVSRFVVQLLQREGVAALPEDDSPDKEELVREADLLRQRRDQLVVDYADGTLTKTELQAAKARISEKLDAVTRRLASSDHAAAVAPVVDVDDVQTAWEALDVHRQRAIVQALVKITLMKASNNRIFEPSDVVIQPRRD